MYIYEIYHVVLHADFMYFYVLCQKWRIKHVQSNNIIHQRIYSFSSKSTNSYNALKMTRQHSYARRRCIRIKMIAKLISIEFEWWVTNCPWTWCRIYIIISSVLPIRNYDTYLCVCGGGGGGGGAVWKMSSFEIWIRETVKFIFTSYFSSDVDEYVKNVSVKKFCLK